MGYWQRAGQRALQGSAHAEAIAHLTQGLAVLTTLPETPARLQQELDLQVALGPALLATQGNAAPEVERAYARARELCAQLGDTPQLFPVLRGLMQYYHEPRGLTDGVPTRGAVAPPGPGPARPGAAPARPPSTGDGLVLCGASRPRPAPTTRRPWRSMTRRRTGPWRCATAWTSAWLLTAIWPGRCGTWAFLSRPCQHSQAALHPGAGGGAPL